MSIVRINAITVPEGAGPELLARFQHRVGEVENMEGFENFETSKIIHASQNLVTEMLGQKDNLFSWKDKAQFFFFHGICA